MPSVAAYMTPGPHAIAAHEPLSRAIRLMLAFDVRHLPVLRKGQLAGILSDRDVNLVRSMADAPASQITVEDAMTPEPYSVSPDAPLDEVARIMAERKVGSAVVMDHGLVVGVFTTTDALRALFDTLQEKAPPAPQRRRA